MPLGARFDLANRTPPSIFVRDIVDILQENRGLEVGVKPAKYTAIKGAHVHVAMAWTWTTRCLVVAHLHSNVVQGRARRVNLAGKTHKEESFMCMVYPCPSPLQWPANPKQLSTPRRP